MQVNGKPELLVKTRAVGRIAILTLNRPENRNAFNASPISTLTETMARQCGQ